MNEKLRQEFITQKKFPKFFEATFVRFLREELIEGTKLRID